jgi:hypothetical protein
MITEITIPLVFAVLGAIILAGIVFGVVWVRANRQAGEHRTLAEAIEAASDKLGSLQTRVEAARAQFEQLNSETKELQTLKANADKLANFVQSAKETALAHKEMLQTQKQQLAADRQRLEQLMSQVDVYSRIDEFTQVGHYETPEYLYETAERFQVEIKSVRDSQKELISDKQAIVFPEDVEITGDKTLDRKILDGQSKLLLTAFNIKCDFLIGKVNPGNYPRTLEQIEKQANTLEKSAADLNCGFTEEYVELKFKECRLQYQFKLKKQEEMEEQRLIREQMREEEKARREYEAAVKKAEEEERIYHEMLERARQQLADATADERLVAEQRIADLERQLAEAEARGIRAKSLAEQTRRGHVYIISNIGSFGEGIYKIGLTRRLDPIDRVKELGDASVPFSFDVHAIIFAEDAPGMESALHREFTNHRVNAVNLRKEFFRVDLHRIKQAVEKISGGEADFRMTVIAEEYFETRRLRAELSAA